MITNTEGIPQSIVNAIIASRNRYNRGNSDYTATELQLPPRIRALRMRHKDEIVEDASDLIFSLIGSIGHMIVETSDGAEGDIVEERVFAEVAGKIVSAQLDLAREDEGGMSINDFKFTSVFQFKDGIKDDYIAQLNIQRYLLKRDKGIDAVRLNSIPIFRDWAKSRVGTAPNYPAQQIQVLPAPMWKHEETEAYIKERIAIHESCNGKKDDELPLCTPKDRWERGEAYVVIAEGAKRATKSFYCDSALNAKKLAEDLATNLTKSSGKKVNAKTKEVTFGPPKKKYVVEHRDGTNMRCESYCPVASFCFFYQKVVVPKMIRDSQKENSQEEE